MLNNLFKNGVSIYEDEADKLNQIGCGYDIVGDYETAVEFWEKAGGCSRSNDDVEELQSFLDEHYRKFLK